MTEKNPNQSHLSSEDLLEIEKSLKQRHENLVLRLRGHEEATTQELPQNTKEAMTMREEMDIIESEEVLEDNQIGLIKKALQRLANKDYGFCSECGGPIPVGRLKAIPEAPYCVPCQEKKEKKK